MELGFARITAVLILLAAPAPAEQDRSQAIAELEARLPAATGVERLELLVELSELHRNEASIPLAEEALALLVETPDPRLELRLTWRLLYAHASRRELPAALEMGARAEQLARRLQDSRMLGRTLRRLGDVHRYGSDFEQALRCYREAIGHSEQAGDQSNLGEVHNNKAQVQIKLGRYAEALAGHLRAREAFTAAGNLSGVGTTLLNIGLEYSRRGEDDTAMGYYQEALQIAESGAPGPGFHKLRGHSLTLMATVHLERDESQRARELLLEALDWFHRAGHRQRVALTLGELADVHISLGELDRAAVQTRQAIELAEQVGDDGLLLDNWRRLAQIDYLRGDRPAAIRRLQRAEQHAREVEHDNQLRGILGLLADLQAEAGRFDQAYAAFREHEELKSRGADEQSRQALAQMQARLDLERREKELEQSRSKQEVQRLELSRQSDLRRGLLVGFGLLLAVLGLAFNRYRQKILADRLRESVAQAEAVNERLRAIDKLKDDLLANTSHELRTPLYGMTGLAESLAGGAKGEPPEAMREDLEMIVSSGRRLSRLVDDILDFSKLRRASLALDRRPVELHALADIVLTLSRPLVAAKDVELRNAVAADLPLAMADENRVQQILHNLVGNAIKFTESGHVEVSARRRGEHLVIEVADTGIGIAEEDRERIFVAFEQADGSADRSFGGTGLGLAVSLQLAEQHGGELWLDSTSPAGSTFAFTLPVADSQASAPELSEPSPELLPATQPLPTVRNAETPRANSSRPAHGQAKILAVDDEPVNLQVLRNFLDAAGHDVTLASSGEEALRLIEQQNFDLVLLDVMMPRLSGYEVCRALRQRHPIAQLPVIFLTARGRDTDIETGMAEGANDYLSKPISERRLLARLGPHLEVLGVHRNLESLVEQKISQVKVLSGLLPICSGCKKIRDDEGYWNKLESFIDQHSEAEFSHGICPSCVKQLYGIELEARTAN